MISLLATDRHLSSEFKVTSMTFSSGESHAYLPDFRDKNGDFTEICPPQEINFVWQYESDAELMQLAILMDAFKTARLNDPAYCAVVRVVLSLPYCPHTFPSAHDGGQEVNHALRAFARFLNSFNFDEVRILAPHSPLIMTLIDNSSSVSWHEAAYRLPKQDALITLGEGLQSEVRELIKEREFDTKAMVATQHPIYGTDELGFFVSGSEHLAAKTICVAHSVCDSGDLLVNLGRRLRASNPAQLNLYVSHGLFTAGLDTLLSVYDHIYYGNRPSQKELIIPKEVGGLPRLTHLKAMPL